MISVLLVLFLASSLIKAQLVPFKRDIKADSVLMWQLMRAETERLLPGISKQHYFVNRDSRVLYSTDSCLKIVQSRVLPDNKGTTWVPKSILHYRRGDKPVRIEIKEGKGIVDLPNVCIYRLPGKKDDYLALGRDLIIANWNEEGEIKWELDTIPFEVENDRAELTAVHFRLEGDTMRIVPFASSKNYGSDRLFSFLEAQPVIVSKVLPEKQVWPCIKYNAQKSELMFRSVFCYGSRFAEEGTCNFYKLAELVFKFTDSGFVFTQDSLWIFPSLKEAGHTVREKYRFGPYTVKATGNYSYEEGRESIIEELSCSYSINNVTIDYTTNLEDDPSFSNLKPECKIQKDTSLLIKTKSSYMPHHNGMCGACVDEETHIWCVKKNKVVELMSWSASMQSNTATFSYLKNGKMRTQEIILNASESGEDSFDFKETEGFWKGNSTYVVHSHNDDYERSYYFDFNGLNAAQPVKLRIGNLIEIKKN